MPENWESTGTPWGEPLPGRWLDSTPASRLRCLPAGGRESPRQKILPARSILRPTGGRQAVLHNHRLLRIPENLKYPILGQTPQNDFNCIFDDLNHNWRAIPDPSLVHFSISPHLNHRHIAESAFARYRFFDVFLKGEGTFPKRPELSVNLKTSNGIPIATVTPHNVEQVQKVQIYYSINPHSLTRFWRRAATAKHGNNWVAHLPILSTNMPLFVMANVEYPLPRPIIGSRYTGNSPDNFLISTWEEIIDPPALKEAGVQAIDRPDRMIERSFDDWEDWYQIGWGNNQHAVAGTRN